MTNEILNKYINNENFIKFKNYSLEGIRNLLSAMGDPHRRFKSVHIAGTNGKGTTAHILAAILHSSGYKTGLYTSPHLLKVNERIKLNSSDISDDILDSYIIKVDSVISDECLENITFFDLMTAAAFQYFSDNHVDIAVVETGLGGRLDSTNILHPELTVITSISMDHNNILGYDLLKIAEEKSGIIKKGVPVITNNISNEIIDVIKSTCSKNDSRLYEYKKDFKAEHIEFKNGCFFFNYISDMSEIYGIEVKLFPEHQINNVAAVIAAADCLRLAGYGKIYLDNIPSLLGDITIPGRFEILKRSPLIIYDSAHNYDALKDILSDLNNYYIKDNIITVVSMMKDKAVKNVIELLNKYDVIYYQLDDGRAFIPQSSEFKNIVNDIDKLIDNLGKKYKNNSVILITGTFRIYGLAKIIAEKI